eukprot:NODE_3496_length_956_cov_126.094089_g3346_i0.p1 GENE.NODE_3496_length_956_cov_126.094089_g3346_i0~~NODE_3496_length_956_cov_126.094089_g3346_i0.p1  ORF type:complete len:245 (+),score=57.28 NODE_3496_length_956_cov_126.094089_g3346_i0:77-811(+)
MGCGASSSPDAAITTCSQSPSQKEREEHRNEVMDKYKLSEKDRSRILTFPIFKIPTRHLVEPHLIDFVFFGVKDDSCTEVTAFFLDKGHDTDITERRGINFSLIKNEEHSTYTRIFFNHSWSEGEGWEAAPKEEIPTHTEPWESFEVEEGIKSEETPEPTARPILYVNTANHLLGHQPTSGETEFSSVSDYTSYSGTMKQAIEIVLRASEAANPEKKEISPLAQLIPVRASHAPSKATKDKKPK